jgi:hypothetical protein
MTSVFGTTVHRRARDRATNPGRTHAASHTTPACLAANEPPVILCRIAASSKNQEWLHRTRPATLTMI